MFIAWRSCCKKRQVMPPAAKAAWWGSQVSAITVDVEHVTDLDRERLSVPTCCTGASPLLCRCGFCCLLTVLVPIALLTSDNFTRDLLDGSLPVLAAILLVIGICICCCSIRKTCCEGVLNVPDPDLLVPPLCHQGSKVIDVRHVLIIYNPNAGKRLASTIMDEVVLPGLKHRGVRCETVATERIGHARDIAATRDLSGLDALVTLGGDGTFHELVNGLFARQDGCRVPVSLIPLGSGNGLAATLRQNMRRRGTEVPVWAELDEVLQWSLDTIAGGRIAHLDLLEVEVQGRRILSVMQVFFGLLAEVDILAEPFRWMGPARLELISIWSILKKSSKDLKCVVKKADGSSHELQPHAVGGCVGLSQHFDGKLRAVPHAQLDDGLAELNIVSAEASVDDTLAGFLKMPHGAHTKDESWQSEQIVAVDLDFGGAGVFNVDGEILEHDGKLHLQVLPQVLDILVGKEEWATAGPAAAAAQPPYRSYKSRWAMLAIFCCMSMVNQAIWIGFSPVAHRVAEKYSVSEDFVNMLSLVFMIIYVPACFPASYAIDVYGCRFALCVGSALNLLGAGLRCAQPPGSGLPAYLVMGGQILCAFAQPCFTNMPPKIAVVWFPAYQRALADTIASLAGTVGAAIGFLLPTSLGLQQMLYVHFGWSILAAGLCWFGFSASPPTPPSPFGERQHGATAFVKELGDALKNCRLWCLLLAFACALGSFNCLSTLSEQLTKPLGFNSDDASNFGVFVVASGILGAAVMTTIVGYTEKYRPVLLVCTALCILFGALAVNVALDGPGAGLPAMNIAFAGIGFGATPVMPVAFEAAAHTAYPTGEGTLAGLCMSGGQILGVGHTLLVSQLIKRDLTHIAWIVSLALFVFGFFAVLLFEQRSHLAVSHRGDSMSSSFDASEPLL